MKRYFVVLMSVIMLFTFVACNNGNNPSDDSSSISDKSVSDSVTESEGSSSSSVYEPMPSPPAVDLNDAENTVIYLAGDSTVKTYQENTFIGGWGQFLHLFLKNNTFAVNKSEGGRSSRSFINEGRLTTSAEKNYTSYQSIESTIKAGDYLLIQFGHNDDATKDLYTNYLDRKVPLGEPDEQGIYPTVVPQKVSTDSIPAEYAENIRLTVEKEYASIADETERLQKIEDEYAKRVNAALSTIKNYGSEYYSFDCGGTYKGYLKMYIDFARLKGAIPVLCTPVARVKFDSNGKLLGGPGRHGDNFAYVEAVRQLAQEEECMLIDTFAFTKNLLETVTGQYADYLMALKPNGISGTFPYDYDAQLDAAASDKQWTGMEATHYNRFGAFVTAAYVAETLYNFASDNYFTEYNETITFGSDISLVPSYFVTCPSHLSSKFDSVKALFTKAHIAK